MVRDQLYVVGAGQWSVVSGQWSVVSDQWSVTGPGFRFVATPKRTAPFTLMFTSGAPNHFHKDRVGVTVLTMGAPFAR